MKQKHNSVLLRTLLRIRPVLRRHRRDPVEGSKLVGVKGDPDTKHFWCPGCEEFHAVTVNGKRNAMNATWSWNGSETAPTFYPSLRTGACHCWITAGRIQFCNDSPKLPGQTVPMVDAKEALRL